MFAIAANLKGGFPLWVAVFGAIIIYVEFVLIHAPHGYDAWFYGYSNVRYPVSTVTTSWYKETATYVFSSFVVGLISTLAHLFQRYGSARSVLFSFVIASGWIFYFEYLIWVPVSEDNPHYVSLTKFMRAWPLFSQITNYEMFFASALSTVIGLSLIIVWMSFESRQNNPSRIHNAFSTVIVLAVLLLIGVLVSAYLQWLS